MRISFTMVMAVLILLISLAGRADAAALEEKSFLKKIEQVLSQPQSKVELGSLARYQNRIVAGLEKKHPNFTKITNLGTLPATVEKTDYGQSDKCYLLEVREENEIFYYEVTVTTISRAPSDVIPAHISKISITVKVFGKAELIEMLQSLQEK